MASLQAEVTSAADLGRDLLERILSALGAQALARAACVCRAWSSAAASERLWESLAEREMGVRTCPQEDAGAHGGSGFRHLFAACQVGHGGAILPHVFAACQVRSWACQMRGMKVAVSGTCSPHAR